MRTSWNCWSWTGFLHEDLHRGSWRNTQRPAPTKGLAGCSTHAPWVLGTTGQIGMYHPNWKLLYPLPSNPPILLQIERIRRKGTFETLRTCSRSSTQTPYFLKLAAVRAAGSRATKDLSRVVPLTSQKPLLPGPSWEENQETPEEGVGTLGQTWPCFRHCLLPHPTQGACMGVASSASLERALCGNQKP